MKLLRILILAFISGAGLTCQSYAQEFITIEGEVTKVLKLSIKDLEKYPVAEIKIKDQKGEEHVYRGTALSVLLDSAGVTLGRNLRGENLTKYVLVTAVDNYQVVYSLAEIDPEFASNLVLLTTHVDGKLLPKGEGPFRLVNQIDKRHARWIREIRSIKVLYSK